MLRADRTAVEKTPLEIEGAFQGYAPRRRLRATSTSPCRRQAHRRTHKLAAQKWIWNPTWLGQVATANMALWRNPGARRKCPRHWCSTCIWVACATSAIKPWWNKMWERWRKFVWGALAVAENYSTKSCQCDEEILAAWRKELCELWKIQVPSKQEATEGEYVRTVLHEMLQAWVKESGDPDGVVVKWLKEGIPLRIELDIQTSGFFPRVGWSWQGGRCPRSRSGGCLLGEARHVQELQERGRGTGRGGDRARMPWGPELPQEDLHGGGRKIVSRWYSSRLGLVSAQDKRERWKEEKIVLDLRRASCQRGSHCQDWQTQWSSWKKSGRGAPPRWPQRWERAGAGWWMLRMHSLCCRWQKKGWSTPWPLPRETQRAPGVPSPVVRLLLYSRFAALVARMQSGIDLNRGGHEVYLDDSLWVLQGTLAARTNTLAYMLNTMGALGIKVSLRKGSRASSAMWIGVNTNLIDKDTRVLGLPDKFLEQLQEADKEIGEHGGRQQGRQGSLVGRCSPEGTMGYGSVLRRGVANPQGRGTSSKRSNRRALFALRRLELARGCGSSASWRRPGYAPCGGFPSQCQKLWLV